MSSGGAPPKDLALEMVEKRIRELRAAGEESLDDAPDAGIDRMDGPTLRKRVKDLGKRIKFHKSRAESTIKMKEKVLEDMDAMKSKMGKLESLCRELQKHNKALTADNTKVRAQEREFRDTTTSKFEVALKSIKDQIEKTDESKSKTIEENNQLRETIALLMKRSDALEQLSKKLDVEKQIAESKLLETLDMARRAVEAADGERARAVAGEKRQKHLEESLAQTSKSFISLKAAVEQSEQVISLYSKETDKCHKRIKKLETEKLSLLRKNEESASMVVGLMDDKKAMAEGLATQKLKAERMANLCRTLQTEVTMLRKHIRDSEDGTGPVDKEGADPVGAPSEESEASTTVETTPEGAAPPTPPS